MAALHPEGLVSRTQKFCALGEVIEQLVTDVVGKTRTTWNDVIPCHLLCRLEDLVQLCRKETGRRGPLVRGEPRARPASQPHLTKDNCVLPTHLVDNNKVFVVYLEEFEVLAKQDLEGRKRRNIRIQKKLC